MIHADCDNCHTRCDSEHVILCRECHGVFFGEEHGVRDLRTDIMRMRQLIHDLIDSVPGNWFTVPLGYRLAVQSVMDEVRQITEKYERKSDEQDKPALDDRGTECR
jgi:hypothetical protein